MQLNKLILINIGPYKGKNVFNLDSNSRQNTILLGGKNGAGKTTLLNSVRIALYGPLTFGFRTISNTYKEKIIDLLNRDHINDSNQRFQIRLEFTLSEELNREEYSVTRQWDVHRNNLEEHVSVLKNNFPLSPVDQENFFELLRSEFPPQLIELCFFDGEEILKLTNDNLLPDYLKTLSHSLFNIDLFDDLERVLENYTEQTANTKQEQELLSELKVLNSNINDKAKKLDVYNEKLLHAETEINAIKEKLHMMNLEFKLHGGLMKEEREEIQLKINNLSNEREQISVELREFLANRLPFYVANNMFRNLVKQLKSEENFYISNALKHKIEILPVQKIIESLNIDSSNELNQKLKDKLINYLVEEEEISTIHHLSNAEAQKIYNVFSEVNKDNISKLIASVAKSRKSLTEIQKLRNLLRDNDENSEFEEIISKINQGNERLRELESDITIMKYEKEQVQRDLEQQLIKKNKLTSILNSLQRKRASFVETEKIMHVSQRFRSAQLRRKVKDMEFFALLMLKEVMRKKNFIESIHLDPENFEIKLFNRNQKEISITSLSAGETQILILSIIWGTLMSSKRNLPLILDTMFSRLDEDHKVSIIKQLIPKFGNQVIILATNSEVTSELYTHLRRQISNEYTLNYNNKEERTIVEPGFFGKTIEGMKVND